MCKNSRQTGKQTEQTYLTPIYNHNLFIFWEKLVIVILAEATSLNYTKAKDQKKTKKGWDKIIKNKLKIGTKLSCTNHRENNKKLFAKTLFNSFTNRPKIPKN